MRVIVEPFNPVLPFCKARLPGLLFTSMTALDAPSGRKTRLTG